ncbi:MAG: lytic transglycosylase domain-containing protein [Gammaproteobacteria bacterium]|nr:lytic transglycosylase domain-containing protein [Gammaproteobacteria bacterium]
MSNYLKLICLAAVLFLPFPAGAIPETRPNPSSPQESWRLYLAKQSKLTPVMSFPFNDCFQRAAAAHGLPVTLLLAVARGESDFDPRAKSDADAHGLMQIQWPGTAIHLGIKRRADLYRPCINIDAGARYLKELLERYRGNLHLALAAYNYGPGRIQVGSAKLPTGAEWYSGYIYRHLTYVLGIESPPTKNRPGTRYTDGGKLQLAIFNRSYRARAFVAAIEQAAPGLRLDWFRTGTGRFHVVMPYTGAQELAKSKRRLAQAGFAMH